jgi:hypothetical protein
MEATKEIETNNTARLTETERGKKTRTTLEHEA